MGLVVVLLAVLAFALWGDCHGSVNLLSRCVWLL